MFLKKLTPQQILKLALPKGTAQPSDLHVAEWVSNNLFLPEDDCPVCGQPDCEGCPYHGCECFDPQCQYSNSHDESPEDYLEDHNTPGGDG